MAGHFCAGQDAARNRAKNECRHHQGSRRPALVSKLENTAYTPAPVRRRTWGIPPGRHRQMERRHQVRRAEDRLALTSLCLLADFADDRHPLLDVSERSLFDGLCAGLAFGFGRGTRIGIGHDLALYAGTQRESYFADKIDHCLNGEGSATVNVNGRSSRAPQSHIKRALPAMTDMGVLKSDDKRAEFRQRQPDRHLALEHAALALKIALAPRLCLCRSRPAQFARRRPGRAAGSRAAPHAPAAASFHADRCARRSDRGRARRAV